MSIKKDKSKQSTISKKSIIDFIISDVKSVVEKGCCEIDVIKVISDNLIKNPDIHSEVRYFLEDWIADGIEKYVNTYHFGLLSFLEKNGGYDKDMLLWIMNDIAIEYSFYLAERWVDEYSRHG